MRDKFIKLIVDHDKKHIEERGTIFYAATLTDEFIDLLKDVSAVCDCECCRAVDRLKDG